MVNFVENTTKSLLFGRQNEPPQPVTQGNVEGGIGPQVQGIGLWP
jgi:hypothetical protein